MNRPPPTAPVTLPDTIKVALNFKPPPGTRFPPGLVDAVALSVLRAIRGGVSSSEWAAARREVKVLQTFIQQVTTCLKVYEREFVAARTAARKAAS